MFGQMQVTRMFQLSKLETVDEAVAKLLEFAEYPSQTFAVEGGRGTASGLFLTKRS